MKNIFFIKKVSWKHLGIKDFENATRQIIKKNQCGLVLNSSREKKRIKIKARMFIFFYLFQNEKCYKISD